jgi:rare lipoprotein A
MYHKSNNTGTGRLTRERSPYSIWALVGQPAVGGLVAFVVLYQVSFWSAAQKNFTQRGLASYYADYFHGRNTASGQKYNKHELTCAHRTLPFGSMLRVQNLRNGRETVLKVTDRGPFKSNRILDVSRAAAAQLGMLQAGSAMVFIELIGSGGQIDASDDDKAAARITNREDEAERKPTTTGKDPATPASSGTATAASGQWFRQAGIYTPEGKAVQTPPYLLQTGVFSSHENAQYQCKEIRNSGYSRVYIWVVPRKSMPSKLDYKVLVGGYDSEDLTARAKAELATKGFDCFAVRVTDSGLTGSAAEAPPTRKTDPETPTQKTATASEPESERKDWKAGWYLPSGAAASPSGYGVQVGSLGDDERARSLARELQSQGLTDVYLNVVHKPSGTVLYKVIVGGFSTKAEADKAVQSPRLAKYSGFPLAIE